MNSLSVSFRKVKIDAHHHFWKYSAAEYGWIDDAMSVIRRDFLPPDLEKEIREAGIDGVVSVQARQTLKETRWLLSMAAQNNFIKGVIGRVPLTEHSVRDELDLFRANPWSLGRFAPSLPSASAAELLTLGS